MVPGTGPGRRDQDRRCGLHRRWEVHVDAGYSHSLVCVEDDTELSIGGPKVLAYILSTWTPDTATKGAMSPRKTRIVCRISKEHLSYVREYPTGS